MNSSNIMTDYTVVCSARSSGGTTIEPTCASTCVGIQDCMVNCPCRIQSLDANGPWGEFMDVFFALLPVILLIYVTLKSKPWPTTISLPVAAMLLAFIRLAYFRSDPVLVGGAIIFGLHEALTPLSIMAGAVTLFESMEATYCLPYMMREIKILTDGHPIAECMLIFAFAYLVEGASGFGTPAALSAPMLVSMGHDGVESVVLVLLFNTFATVWGAVGTPIWFGFGSLVNPATDELVTEDDLLRVSQKSAVTLGLTGMILIPFILTILVPRKVVMQNWMFVFLSLLATIGPSAGLAHFNYEFPSLVGGIVGCALNAILINYRVGLKELIDDHAHLSKSVDKINGLSDNGLVAIYHRSVSNLSAELPPNSSTDIITAPIDVPDDEVGNAGEELSRTNVEMIVVNEGDTNGASEVDAKDLRTSQLTSLQDTVESHLGPRKTIKEGYISELLIRTFPIWGVVLVLIITRVETIGLRDLLRKRTPYFSIYLGSYGEFRLSASLVFQLLDIFTYPNLNWKYDLLYIPFIIPFVLISLITITIFRKDLSCKPSAIAGTVLSRLRDPAVALMGALVLVQLMILSDTVAPAYILGTILADWFQKGFIVVSPLLGALGSFFAGSTTISNLTFGSIQIIAAESIGTSFTSMLALQAVGASIGNGICLNNIIAASAVVGLKVGEGVILIKTCKFSFLSTTVATALLAAIYIRF
jgi:L-lactate permease